MLFPPENQDSHLVVEDLGLASLGLGDEGLIENIEDILADLLELGLDLLAVVTDDRDVLLRALGLLLLLNGGDNTPRGTAGTDHVLVSNGEKVTLIDGKLASNLMRGQLDPRVKGGYGGKRGELLVRRR